VRCAECGAETGGAVQVCAVCGAPAVARPSAAVDSTPETCLTCGTVTAEYLPGCPAEAHGEAAKMVAGRRPSGAAGHGRPARGGGQAGPLARAVGDRGWLAHGGLRGHPGHRREVIPGTRARPIAAEVAARGDARVTGVRVRAAHHAVPWWWRRWRGMISSSVARTRVRGGSRTAAPAFPGLSRYPAWAWKALRPAQRHGRQLAPKLPRPDEQTSRMFTRAGFAGKPS
jgi:hypothetical protein